MNNKVSVVIPTKNGGPLFAEVMQKLAQQSYTPGYEILVIDSGSTDDTVTIAKKYGAKVLTIPPHDFNHGQTRDFGIEQASGDIIVLITQDATPCDSHLISNLVKPFDDPDIAGSYARQIPRPDADILTKRNLSSWLTGRTEPEVRAITDRKKYETMSPLERYFFCNFDNVCSSVRKQVWKSIPFGPHDFGEDIAWSKRVLEAGYKILYQPTAAVIHSHDRPISYEYRRTYMCHRKLYRQFGLHLVPTLKGLGRAWAYSSLSDMKFIARTEKRIAVVLKMLFKVPILNFFSALAQYRAVKDEIRGVNKKVGGI